MIRSLLEIPVGGLRAVTFDVGGTLIEPWPSVGHVYAEVAAKNGLSGLDPDELNRRFRLAWRAKESFTHTRSEWAALVDATFLKIAPIPPSESFFEELYDRFSEASAWRIFDDSLPALDRLKRAGLKLGVISNWDDRLRTLLRNLDLDGWFETIVVSCEVGAQKPSRIVFDRAAASLSLRPEEILHVGDEPVADVQGAQAAGFKAELLQRRGQG